MSLIVRWYPALGRGVYSTVPLRKRDVVEVSPVIVLTRKDWQAIRRTQLHRYVFAWGKHGRGRALPLGLGGVFNHSDDPNMNFRLNHHNESITFRATRDIARGEQLTIDYGWTADERRRWFIGAGRRSRPGSATNRATAHHPRPSSSLGSGR